MNYNILVKMNLEYTKSSIGSIDKVILHKIKHYKEKDKLKKRKITNDYVSIEDVKNLLQDISFCDGNSHCHIYIFCHIRTHNLRLFATFHYHLLPFYYHFHCFCVYRLTNVLHNHIF